MGTHTFIQQTAVKHKFMINLITNNPTPRPARTTLIIRDYPGLKCMPVDDNAEREVRVQLRGIIDISVSSCCFGASELNRKGCCFLVFQIWFCEGE